MNLESLSTHRLQGESVTVEGVDEVSIGYAFLPEYWGRGLATEMAEASVAIAWNKLRLTSGSVDV